MEEKIKEIVRSYKLQYEFGGDEDEDGNLQPGEIDFDMLEEDLIEALTSKPVSEMDDVEQFIHVLKTLASC